MEEMEEAFSNFKVILFMQLISIPSIVQGDTLWNSLTIFFSGSQRLEEHLQGCQHPNHHFHHVVCSLHFLTGRQQFLGS